MQELCDPERRIRVPQKKTYILWKGLHIFIAYFLIYTHVDLIVLLSEKM